ncbi:MAG: 2-C-methyl-D-erythritol 4-phosphate cytidylyltransferase [Pyrinomonadaceae bacterium]
MNVAIIAAAGQGVRMGGNQAKQFLQLGGIPIVIHTLKRFEQSAAIDECILVLPAADTAGFLDQAGRFGLRKLSQVIAGGDSRRDSVFRGLLAIREATVEIVAVHDGVRPFVTTGEIDRTIAAAREHGAAVLVAPATDTIKEVEQGRVIRTLPREKVRHALTPQCFRYELLRRAYEQLTEADGDITDDSMLVERLGETVAVVEGNPRNIKITRPEDIALAEIILRQEPEFRSQTSEGRGQKSE